MNTKLKGKIDKIDWIKEIPIDLLFTESHEIISSFPKTENNKSSAYFKKYSTFSSEVLIPIRPIVKMISTKNYIPNK